MTKTIIDCKCGCGTKLETPNKWGHRCEFVRGHNARMDPERRAIQININRDNSQSKRLAVMRTDAYKENMSVTKKEEWKIRKEEEPEKAKEIIGKLHDGRDKIVLPRLSIIQIASGGEGYPRLRH